MRLPWAIPLLCLAEEDRSGLLQSEQLLKKFTAELDCKSGRCHPKTTTPPPNKPEIPPVVIKPPVKPVVIKPPVKPVVIKPPVKPVTTPAPFEVVPTTTSPVTTTPTTPVGRLPPTELNVVANGCEKFGKKFKHVKEDCTNKDMFILRTSNINAAFIAPTYAPDQYGTDENWMTKKVQESDWKGACVAYVNTGRIKGRTCKQFCKSNGMKCVQGMDDAHHQTAGLSKWLSTEGYKATDCTLLPGGHSRQSKADNGCNQRWGTQMCACNPVKPRPVKPVIIKPPVKPVTTAAPIEVTPGPLTGKPCRGDDCESRASCTDGQFVLTCSSDNTKGGDGLHISPDGRTCISNSGPGAKATCGQIAPMVVTSSKGGSQEFLDNRDVSAACPSGAPSMCLCWSPWKVSAICGGNAVFEPTGNQCTRSIPASPGRRRGSGRGAGAQITAICPLPAVVAPNKTPVKPVTTSAPGSAGQVGRAGCAEAKAIQKGEKLLEISDCEEKPVEIPSVEEKPLEIPNVEKTP